MLAFIALVCIVTLLSVVPVIGQGLALKRRIDTLKDHQVFVALSAVHTDLESVERSFSALSAHIQALRAALVEISESSAALRRIPQTTGLAELKTQFAALLNVLR
ncbi:MAG: hypothetical protein M3N19_01465 [Candidatus Eremiobacteraeota bacterium]|nr:hypothetical protein [Candidatus Eremiobacteraeota bacterium]